MIITVQTVEGKDKKNKKRRTLEVSHNRSLFLNALSPFPSFSFSSGGLNVQGRALVKTWSMEGLKEKQASVVHLVSFRARKVLERIL